jgi:uncharacterized radical SAM superfamily Fe-S cluster-containing enzyme
MESVTANRTVPGSVSSVREAMLELEPFTRAAGFDEVSVDGRTIHVANDVGLTEISLELEVLADTDTTLAYEQRDGIFEEMWTRYTVDETANGTEVTATTEFALDVAVVGSVLDATVIKRQRRKELEAQFDYLEEAVEASASNATS